MKNSGSIQESTSSTGISVLIVLALGFLMATLDVTVVNVAMADMKNTLSMSLSGVTWVVDGYILTFASLLLAAPSHLPAAASCQKRSHFIVSGSVRRSDWFPVADSFSASACHIRTRHCLHWTSSTRNGSLRRTARG